jgi:hypothetical protein
MRTNSSGCEGGLPEEWTSGSVRQPFKKARLCPVLNIIQFRGFTIDSTEGSGSGETRGGRWLEARSYDWKPRHYKHPSKTNVVTLPGQHIN